MGHKQSLRDIVLALSKVMVLGQSEVRAIHENIALMGTYLYIYNYRKKNNQQAPNT